VLKEAAIKEMLKKTEDRDGSLSKAGEINIENLKKPYKEVIK
jgi:hypothetical protein